MLTFKPNLDAQLIPSHLRQSLLPFIQTPYAFANEYEDLYYAFPADVIVPGFFETKGNKTLEEWIKDRFWASDIRPVMYTPGHFYRRMWQPSKYLAREFLAPSQQLLTQSALAIEILLKRMQELLLVIEPEPENLAVFGHKIREVLLLACMEVEASWIGVLKEHEYINQ